MEQTFEPRAVWIEALESGLSFPVSFLSLQCCPIKPTRHLLFPVTPGKPLHLVLHTWLLLCGWSKAPEIRFLSGNGRKSSISSIWNSCPWCRPFSHPPPTLLYYNRTFQLYFVLSREVKEKDRLKKPVHPTLTVWIVLWSPVPIYLQFHSPKPRPFAHLQVIFSGEPLCLV